MGTAHMPNAKACFQLRHRQTASHIMKTSQKSYRQAEVVTSHCPLYTQSDKRVSSLSRNGGTKDVIQPIDTEQTRVRFNSREYPVQIRARDSCKILSVR